MASASGLTITVTGSFRIFTGFPFHRIHIRTYFLRLDCRPYEHLILYSHFLHILSMKPTFYFVISYQDYSAIPLRFHLIFTLISLHFRHSEKFENKKYPHFSARAWRYSILEYVLCYPLCIILVICFGQTPDSVLPIHPAVLPAG